MTAEWDLVITARDGTPVHTFSADDFDPATSPLLAAEGQDTRNDLGIAQLVLPSEHDANDYLTPDNLVHLYVRGAYVTSYIVKVPLVNPVNASGEASEFAVYQLAHLLAVTEEGIVEPPGGMDSKPASADRIFDSSDPARDNSDFTTPDELGSVTDAQSNYAVTPYAEGMEYPNDVQVICPAGYGWTDITPEGRCYFYIDHDFGGGTYRPNGTGDNFIEGRIDGLTFLPRTQGFGRASTPPKMNISGGVHRVWFCVESIGPGATQGVLTLAFEFVEVDAADNAIGLELATSAAWGICEFPPEPPGFNGGELILTSLGEEQALGAMIDVACSFDGDVDSNGDPWAQSVNMSTKSLAGLEQFWVRELTNALIDIDAHWNGSQIVIDAWNKGHTVPSTLILTEGENLGSLSIPGEPRVMSQAAVVWNDGGDLAFHTVQVAAPTGRPVHRRPLSLGAARSIEQITRDANSQLDIFNRKREKPTVRHLTNRETPDEELPPSYWKWSTIYADVTSRWIDSGAIDGGSPSAPLDELDGGAPSPDSYDTTSGGSPDFAGLAELDLIAVTWRLNGNGDIEFTPEASDLIIPAEARSTWTLRKMAGPSLGGRSRVASYFGSR